MKRKMCINNGGPRGEHYASWKASNTAGDTAYACGEHLGQACAAVTLWVRPTHTRATVDMLP